MRAVTIDAPASVVVGLFSGSYALWRRARENPDTLYVDIGGSGQIARRGIVVRVSPRTRIVMAALLAIPGRIVTRAELLEILFGDDAEGGPDCADQALGQALAGARVTGAALGFAIVTVKGRGLCARFTAARPGGKAT